MKSLLRHGRASYCATRAVAAVAAKSTSEMKISPSARVLLCQLNIDISNIIPALRKDVLNKSDIQTYLDSLKATGSRRGAKVGAVSASESSQSRPVAAASAVDQALRSFVQPPPTAAARVGAALSAADVRTTSAARSAVAPIDTPLSSMRATIARRLSASKQSIPHAYCLVECTMDELLKIRVDINKNLPPNSQHVSVNDMLIKAVAVALKSDASLLAVAEQRSKSGAGEVDVAFAVATDGGLLTPIVRAASRLGVGQIAAATRDLAARARKGLLKPDEYLGGHVTLSNLGMFSVDSFTAIINQPQAFILAIGQTKRALDDVGHVRQRCAIQMSFDQQVVDEQSAGGFLQQLKNLMESPSFLLL